MGMLLKKKIAMGIRKRKMKKERNVMQFVLQLEYVADEDDQSNIYRLC